MNFFDIIDKKKTKHEGIYKIKTSTNDVFILKELDILRKGTGVSSLYPFLTEAMISNMFNSPYLHKAKQVAFNASKLNIISDKATGDIYTTNKQKDILAWMYSLTKAVKHLHERHILHGDIKGQNVLVFEDGVKLADFDMSVLILDEPKQYFPEGVKLYTPSHRAPEVWLSNDWGFSADIWALGCTFFEILYGYKFFQDQETQEEYLASIDSWKIGTQPVKGNKLLYPPENSTLYAAHNNLITRMLNPNPEVRPKINDVLSDRIFLSLQSTYSVKKEDNTNFSSRPSSPFESPFSSNYTSPGSSYNSTNGYLSVAPTLESLFNSPTFVSYMENATINELAFQKYNKCYNVNHFSAKNILEDIKSYITDFFDDFPNMTLMDFIVSLYESLRVNGPLNEGLLRACCIIMYTICYRTSPVILTQKDITNILIVSNKVKFEYINYIKMYRCRT